MLLREKKLEGSKFICEWWVPPLPRDMTIAFVNLLAVLLSLQYSC